MLNLDTIGDFTKFKISDVGKIFNTLTKNLYPNPLLTVLIETVSNAHDSMVMAGKKDDPIFIKYDPTTSELSIKDTGEGMSPEFMDEGYTDVGFSKKESLVETIGRYGLGRLSCLAYSPQYFVDTIWDKVKYTYLISENPLSTPDIELLTSIPVDDCNGVTVRLTLKRSDIYTVEKYIKVYLRYFPTLIVEGLNYDENYKVVEGETFKFITPQIKDTLKILNGCTLFPVNYGLINRRGLGSGQVLKFDLSEGLVATPNRADLIWNPATIKKVQDKYDAHLKELEYLYNEQGTFFESMFDYKRHNDIIKIENFELTTYVNSENYYTGNLPFNVFRSFNHYTPKALFKYITMFGARNIYVHFTNTYDSFVIIDKEMKPSLLHKYKKAFKDIKFVTLRSREELLDNFKDEKNKDVIAFYLEEREIFLKRVKTISELVLPVSTVVKSTTPKTKRNTTITGHLYKPNSYRSGTASTYPLERINNKHVIYYTVEEENTGKIDLRFFRYYLSFKKLPYEFFRIPANQVNKIKFLDKAIEMKKFLSSKMFLKIYNKAAIKDKLFQAAPTWFTYKGKIVGYRNDTKLTWNERTALYTFEKYQPFLYQEVVDRFLRKSSKESEFYSEGLYKYLYLKQKQLKNDKIQTNK